MDRQVIQAICAQVNKKFPGTSGVQPKVTQQSETQYVLVFKFSAQTADGRNLPQTVRVVADAAGKISKMTASH
ncbi:MAG: hypothetical protein HY835_02400 [Anaerolineae bacterium]|nr:hypothetical protein [Anaerolineae bacterium]